MLTRAVAGLAALVFVLTGCGKPGAPASGAAPAAPGEPVFVEPSCPKARFGDDPAPGGTIPEDFATSWVLRCRTDLRDKPGQGKWQVQLTERAETPATELVEALRQPSEPRTTGACTLELVVPPYFALVDAAGTAVHPAVPTDPCGKPRREILAMLDKFSYRTLSETPLNQVQSPDSERTGCPDKWKDMITIERDTAKPGPAKPLSPSSAEAVRVCVYGQITDGQVPGGTLLSGHTITDEAATALRTALAKAGPAAACSTEHTRFAVLHPADTGTWAMVELDGCHRILRTDNTFGQLDEATVRLLSK